METKTPPQSRVDASDGVAASTISGASYKKFRLMRHDPTIALGRKLLRAGVMVSKWSTDASDAAPEGAKELIDDIMQPLRQNLLRLAMLAWMDFGWAPWEKIVVPAKQPGKWGVVLKPLLQDMTEILVDEDTGEKLGVRQDVDGNNIDLEYPSECVIMSFDEEGQQWYGIPTMLDCELAFDKWINIEQAAARYDAKIAGTSWVIYYPVGTSNFRGQEDVDNFNIAQEILKAMESSGMVAIPKDLDKYVQDQVGGTPADFSWKIELLTDESKGRDAFTDRQKYLDALKMRGVGIPERAVLEGQFGTKAEAGAHGDFAIVNIELMHSTILEQVNTQLVNWLLTVNYGEAASGTVWLEAAPLADASLAFLQTLYGGITQSPEAGMEEVGMIDMDSLRDRLGVPSGQTNQALATPDDAANVLLSLLG